MEFDYDLLLEYLSYKNCGKYIHFKNYIKNLTYDEKDVKDISFSQIRRTLSALGHVEFLFDGNKQIFKVAPRVISILPNSTKGVLCGYRTHDFLENLHKRCKDLDLEYIEEDNHKAPKAIFIDFKKKENIKFCQDNISLLGDDIKIITDFSKKLLSSYPNIDNLIEHAPNYDDIGNVEVYSTNKHDFCNMAKKDFYVCKNSEKYYVFRFDAEKPYYEVDKYTAILKQYQKYKNEILELEENQLKIKYIQSLPDLIDRALTLASGKNRKKDGNSIVYDNISKDIVVLLCEKTGLNLEVKNG